MHQQKKTRRVRAMAIGAVVASIVAVGAASGSASAAQQDKSDSTVTVSVKTDIGSMSLRSGIRW